MWLRGMLGKLGYNQTPTRLWCDNQGTIALSNKPNTHQRTKHINIKHHLIRGLVERRTSHLIMCLQTHSKRISSPHHCQDLATHTIQESGLDWPPVYLLSNLDKVEVGRSPKVENARTYRSKGSHSEASEIYALKGSRGSVGEMRTDFQGRTIRSHEGNVSENNEIFGY